MKNLKDILIERLVISKTKEMIKSNITLETYVRWSNSSEYEISQKQLAKVKSSKDIFEQIECEGFVGAEYNINNCYAFYKTYKKEYLCNLTQKIVKNAYLPYIIEFDLLNIHFKLYCYGNFAEDMKHLFNEEIKIIE